MSVTRTWVKQARTSVSVCPLRFALGCLLVVICPPLESANVVLYLYDCGITPVPNISVNVGDTITWAKQFPGDPAAYRVESYTGEFQSPPITTNVFYFSFNQPGTFYFRAYGLVMDPRITSGTITVLPWSNGPPDITLTTPVEGFWFVQGGPVTLQTSTSESLSNGLQLEYFAGIKSLGAARPAPYTLETQAGL